MTVNAETMTSEQMLLEAVQGAGKTEMASGKAPLLLSGKASVWYVESGRIELFTVAVEDDEPVGARSHFATIESGQIMFGMDLERYGMGNGFLAVGKIGTKLQKLPVSMLHQMGANPSLADAVSDVVDTWIDTMSKGLTRDIVPRPIVHVGINPGEEVALEDQQRLRASKGVGWLEVKGGDLLYVGMEQLVFSGARVLFPVSHDSWVEAAGDTTVVQSYSLDDILVKPAVWYGIELFHEALCQSEFINKKLAVVDEFNRLRSKADYANEAARLAIQDLASVLESKRPEEQTVVEVTDHGDAVFAVCERIGRDAGFKVIRHPAPRENADTQLRAAEIAAASGFRTRPVALRGDWWNQDQGPILGVRVEGDEPVALIPDGPRDYKLYDPRTGKTTKVTDKNAAEISGFGLTFYRPFPRGKISVPAIMRFGLRGVERDLAYIVLAAVATGILSLLIPYAMGQIFDSAIPQAEKGALMQFAVALLVAATVSSAFRIVQSIAVLRMQGRMEYSIQSAMWDRLLNLPMTFFGKYNAGDLAERAAGVSEIRELLAGSAISAILGVMTAIFYVGILFKYSVKMAILAIGLTIFFVAFTTAMNFAQLRFQRDRMRISGGISGLVLQLISGVAKIRTSGAENHAFRTWARQFSELRTITFSMRNIQNWVEVFNALFPLLSSMAIFYTLHSLQTSAASGAAMSTGEFIAFTAAFGLFIASMQSLAEASMGMLAIVPIYERFKPILLTEPEADESKAYPGRLSGAIELSHLHFKYDDDGPWILSDVSIKIEPGEFIAFVGGSGSGKSTTMRMMLGFETPQKGTVYYDGQDLNTLDLREVRKQIGVVLQTSRVLPTDIFRNIVGTSNLTVEDAWDAAEAVGLADDIREMPMGMHTYVAEGGGGFSGGQKQRLLIARAVVHKPRILFLDEATSALDNRTQAIVTESMNRLQSTRIVIAHRLSTIVDADRIVVLEKGVIEEIGSYDELIAANGMFAELARRQIA